MEGHSEQEIKNYIDKFHTLGSNLPKKDINLYSFEELKSSLDNYTSKNQKDKTTSSDVDVVYEDERFFIVRPVNFQQSAKYGRGTKWCITATDGTGENAWNGYYINYQNAFYFITDKSLPSTDPLHKVCITVDRDGKIQNGENTTVNALDEPINGKEYLKSKKLPLKLFVPRDLSPLEKWKMDTYRLENGIFFGCISAPKDLKEFRGFKEELGLDIKEIRGYLQFERCEYLTSVSNLPETITGSLSFSKCNSLTSISNLPQYVGGFYISDCDNLESIPEMPDFIDGILNISRCGSLKHVSVFPEKITSRISIENCISLVSVSNLPEIINRDLRLSHCYSLVSISDIPETVGGLYLNGCTSLTSVSKMPKTILASLSFDKCTSLTSLPNMPSVVTGEIDVDKCPLFKGMNEDFVRHVYKISK